MTEQSRGGNRSTYLYLYRNSDIGAVYIGIGDSMRRAWETHNPDAEALRDTPGTVVLQTIEPFSSRADARKAEAIAIQVAAMAGMRVVSDIDELVVTNRAGLDRTAVLGPAVFVRDGEVEWSTLEGTIILPIKHDSIDARPALHGGYAARAFAERTRQWWSLGAAAQRGLPVRRALGVLTGTRIILGDWDVDPESPFSQGEQGWSLNLVDELADDPRGVRGMKLVGHRLNVGHTYSADLR